MKLFWDLVEKVQESKRPDKLSETIEEAAIAIVSWILLLNGMLLLAGVHSSVLLKP